MLCPMAAKVFIDGQEGTTGLEIHERLASRPDVELVTIASDQRKDPSARRACIESADVTILCLPDAAAEEAVALTSAGRGRFIDASTAHRTAPGWTYGLPELAPVQRDAIRRARLVSNPGCHATGAVLLLRPLVDSGILPPDYPVFVHSITGYSGGGKKLIQSFQEGPSEKVAPPRPYALGLKHKHLPEIETYAGLDHAPGFLPVVGPFYRGMLVSVPLEVRRLRRRVGPHEVREVYLGRYGGEAFLRVMPLDDPSALDDGTHLSPLGCNGTNRVDLFVFGHGEQLMVTARLDNLGKGASGAAVQNLNLMLGAPEDAGLAHGRSGHG